MSQHTDEKRETVEQRMASDLQAASSGVNGAGVRTAAIELRGVQFSYRAGRGDLAEGAGVVLDVPGLVIAPGEQVLLHGPSGSGKSTLLHLIAGLAGGRAGGSQGAMSGEILVEGQSLAKLGAAQLDLFRGRRLGVVFQTLNLLQGFTAAENVMLAMHFSQVPAGQQREKAVATLARLGLKDVDRPVERLSLGQQQRVAVARAVVNQPAGVLADEPTASLDRTHANAAMDLLMEACQQAGCALVVASHDEMMLSRFARAIRLEAGRIVSDGSPAASGTTAGRKS